MFAVRLGRERARHQSLSDGRFPSVGFIGWPIPRERHGHSPHIVEKKRRRQASDDIERFIPAVSKRHIQHQIGSVRSVREGMSTTHFKIAGRFVPRRCHDIAFRVSLGGFGPSAGKTAGDRKTEGGE